MNAGQRHEEIQRLNREPENVLAKKLLKKTDQEPHSRTMYLHQLMEWALNSRKKLPIDLEDPWEREILTELNHRLAWNANPRRIFNLLTKEGPDPQGPYPWIDLKEMQHYKTPLRVAQYLTDELYQASRYNDPSPRTDDGDDWMLRPLPR